MFVWKRRTHQISAFGGDRVLVDAKLHLGSAVSAEALPGNMEGARGVEFTPGGILCVDNGRGAGEPGLSVAQVGRGRERCAVEGREGGDVLGGEGEGEGEGCVGVEVGSVGLEEVCAGKGDHGGNRLTYIRLRHADDYVVHAQHLTKLLT